MNREAWRRPTDFETVARRATGRKKFNQRRRLAAAERRRQVKQALHLGRTLWTLEALAARFNVSMATMSRDLAALGVDLARLRRRYEAVDHRPPTYDEMRQHALDMSLILSGSAARWAARAKGLPAPLTPEQNAAVDGAFERVLARGDEAMRRLRARFGLDDE